MAGQLSCIYKGWQTMVPNKTSSSPLLVFWNDSQLQSTNAAYLSKPQIRGLSQDLEGQLAVISDECSALRGALERRSQEIDELRKELDQKTVEAQRLGEKSLQS